jgi:uncharacterized membrane protein
MTMPRRWIFAFLGLFALSLAANLFAGGLMLGRHAFQAKAPLVEQAARRFFETVPEAARPVVRRHFRDNAMTIVSQLQKIRQARAHVAEVLGRPKLDDAALADAFDRLRDSTAALQTLVHGILTEAIKEIPPDARAQWQIRWADGALLRAD